jgi:predicted acyltransferase
MKRLLSLDVFRGMTVAFMIWVNNAGDWEHIYPPFEHASWNGCTPTDLVFPFFLYIVGVSITFSLHDKSLDRQVSKKIIVRTLKLFGLGLFLALFPKFNFQTVRIMGVLQRIALVYGICSFLFLLLTQRSLWLCLAGVLLGYWALMTLVPVPNVGFANLEPTTNLGAWLDRLLLGEAHLYKHAKVWDPEGLLGTLPAIGTGILGIQAGYILHSQYSNAFQKVKYLALLGVIGLCLGLVWDTSFPINKALWSSSYVCYAGGWASLLLAFLYWLIDIEGIYRWTKFFVIYGTNAIAAFFSSGLVPRILGLIKLDNNGTDINAIQYIYTHAIAPWFSNPYNASLAGSLTCVAIWFIALWLLYRKGVIWKI